MYNVHLVIIFGWGLLFCLCQWFGLAHGFQTPAHRPTPARKDILSIMKNNIYL